MRRLFLALAACSFLAACGNTTITIVSPDGASSVSIDVELAVTPAEQQQGLMGRAHLPEDEGMMFVFEHDQPLSFWMKNTLIPLQILFFESDGSFVNALDMVPCAIDEEECPQYRSASIAQYALEVNPGFREAHGIGTGWRLDAGTLTRLAR